MEGGQYVGGFDEERLFPTSRCTSGLTVFPISRLPSRDPVARRDHAARALVVVSLHVCDRSDVFAGLGLATQRHALCSGRASVAVLNLENLSFHAGHWSGVEKSKEDGGWKRAITTSRCYYASTLLTPLLTPCNGRYYWLKWTRLGSGLDWFIDSMRQEYWLAK